MWPCDEVPASELQAQCFVMLPEGGGSQGGLGGMPFCPGWNEAVGARLQAAPVLCKAFSRVEAMMKVRDQMDAIAHGMLY